MRNEGQCFWCPHCLRYIPGGLYKVRMCICVRCHGWYSAWPLDSHGCVSTARTAGATGCTPDLSRDPTQPGSASGRRNIIVLEATDRGYWHSWQE